MQPVVAGVFVLLKSPSLYPSLLDHQCLSNKFYLRKLGLFLGLFQFFLVKFISMNLNFGTFLNGIHFLLFCDRS